MRIMSRRGLYFDIRWQLYRRQIFFFVVKHSFFLYNFWSKNTGLMTLLSFKQTSNDFFPLPEGTIVRDFWFLCQQGICGQHLQGAHNNRRFNDSAKWHPPRCRKLILATNKRTSWLYLARAQRVHSVRTIWRARDGKKQRQPPNTSLRLATSQHLSICWARFHFVLQWRRIR